MTCCFLGHDDIDEDFAAKLEEILLPLIKEGEVDTFLVGNNGNFEENVYEILLRLKISYPHIKCYKVASEAEREVSNMIIYPDGIDAVPKRFKISHKNRWMILKSDYMVARITHHWGDAPRFAEFARRKLVKVINME